MVGSGSRMGIKIKTNSAHLNLELEPGLSLAKKREVSKHYWDVRKEKKTVNVQIKKHKDERATGTWLSVRDRGMGVCEDRTSQWNCYQVDIIRCTFYFEIDISIQISNSYLISNFVNLH